MKTLESKLRALILVLSALIVVSSANYAIGQDKSIKFPKPANKENTTKQQSTNTNKTSTKKRYDNNQEEKYQYNNQEKE